MLAEVSERVVVIPGPDHLAAARAGGGVYGTGDDEVLAGKLDKAAILRR